MYVGKDIHMESKGYCFTTKALAGEYLTVQPPSLVSLKENAKNLY